MNNKNGSTLIKERANAALEKYELGYYEHITLNDLSFIRDLLPLEEADFFSGNNAALREADKREAMYKKIYSEHPEYRGVYTAEPWMILVAELIMDNFSDILRGDKFGRMLPSMSPELFDNYFSRRTDIKLLALPEEKVEVAKDISDIIHHVCKAYRFKRYGTKEVGSRAKGSGFVYHTHYHIDAIPAILPEGIEAGFKTHSKKLVCFYVGNLLFPLSNYGRNALFLSQG